MYQPYNQLNAYQHGIPQSIQPAQLIPTMNINHQSYRTNIPVQTNVNYTPRAIQNVAPLQRQYQQNTNYTMNPTSIMSHIPSNQTISLTHQSPLPAMLPSSTPTIRPAFTCAVTTSTPSQPISPPQSTTPTMSTFNQIIPSSNSTHSTNSTCNTTMATVSHAVSTNTIHHQRYQSSNNDSVANCKQMDVPSSTLGVHTPVPVVPHQHRRSDEEYKNGAESLLNNSLFNAQSIEPVPSLQSKSKSDPKSNSNCNSNPNPYSPLFLAMTDLARNGPSVQDFMSDIKWAEPDTECHDLWRSQSVHRIRNAILKLPQYTERNKAFLIEANKYDDNKFKPSKKELSVIELYINRNHEGNNNPFIRPQAGRGWMRSDQVVGIRKMAPCHWGSFLDGDMEAFAKTQIDAGCILGQYVGVEVTDDEWKTLFHGTREEMKHKKYLGGDTVRIPKTLRYDHKENADGDGDGDGDDDERASVYITDHGEPLRKKRKIIEEREGSLDDDDDNVDGEGEDNEEEEDEVVNLIFDPLLLSRVHSEHRESALMRINDCRANIRKKEPSEEDNKRSNCEMISVLVNGWPTTFIRTTKRIDKNQALYFFYGGAYSYILEEVDMMKLRKEKYRRIADKITSFVKTNTNSTVH